MVIAKRVRITSIMILSFMSLSYIDTLSHPVATVHCRGANALTPSVRRDKLRPMPTVSEMKEDHWGGIDTDSSVVTVCTRAVTEEFSGLLSEGLPVPLACDMIGLDIEMYRDWVVRGSKGETPFNKFLVCTKKAMAMWVYTLTCDASDVTNTEWRRSLEMLKSTKSEYYGGNTVQQKDFEPTPSEYM